MTVDPTSVEQAVALAARTGHVLVATADGDGLPHVAAAAKISLAAGGRVAVEAWFCPGTVANVMVNRRVSLVVWDRHADRGCQLLGEVEHVVDLAVLDGYAAGEEPSSTPQVERQLLVRVTKALSFTLAPHSDLEE